MDFQGFYLEDTVFQLSSPDTAWWMGGRRRSAVEGSRLDEKNQTRVGGSGLGHGVPVLDG